VVKAYHAKADGHLLRRRLVPSDHCRRDRTRSRPRNCGPGQHGYTSFKVFMTYEGLALSDLEMLNV